MGRTMLWREAVGHELRAARRVRQERLRDVADRSGVSTQYLSEVERGRKEPSSEILAALAGALGLTLSVLAARVSRLTAVPDSTAVPDDGAGVVDAVAPVLDLTGGRESTRPAGPPGAVLLAA